MLKKAAALMARKDLTIGTYVNKASEKGTCTILISAMGKLILKRICKFAVFLICCIFFLPFEFFSRYSVSRYFVTLFSNTLFFP